VSYSQPIRSAQCRLLVLGYLHQVKKGMSNV
jgi:hypothetical protein